MLEWTEHETECPERNYYSATGPSKEIVVIYEWKNALNEISGERVTYSRLEIHDPTGMECLVSAKCTDTPLAMQAAETYFSE